MKSIIVYHKQDCDGIVGAAVLYKNIKNIYSYDDIELLGGDYSNNEELLTTIKSVLSNDEKLMLYIVDYSFDAKDIKEILKSDMCQSIAWFDHHVTAIESYLKAGLIKQIEGKVDEYESAHSKMFAYCTPKHSGCYNAYVGMTGNEPKDESIVGLISVFDCWQKHSDFWFKALYLNQYMQEHVYFARYHDLADVIDSNNESEIITKWSELGQTIYNAIQQSKNKYAIEAAFDLMFEGLMFKAINSTPGGSFVVEQEATEDHDALMQFCWKKDRWSFSMYHNPRSAKKPDLSKIAVKFGGGGHPGACGFSAKELPFELTLETK